MVLIFWFWHAIDRFFKTLQHTCCPDKHPCRTRLARSPSSSSIPKANMHILEKSCATMKTIFLNITCVRIILMSWTLTLLHSSWFCYYQIYEHICGVSHTQCSCLSVGWGWSTKHVSAATIFWSYFVHGHIVNVFPFFKNYRRHEKFWIIIIVACQYYQETQMHDQTVQRRSWEHYYQIYKELKSILNLSTNKYNQFLDQ